MLAITAGNGRQRAKWSNCDPREDHRPHDLPHNQIELTKRTHIELDLELTDEGDGLAGELTEPGRPKRTIAGWLQLLDELQRAVERHQPPHDDPAPR